MHALQIYACVSLAYTHTHTHTHTHTCICMHAHIHASTNPHTHTHDRDGTIQNFCHVKENYVMTCHMLRHNLYHIARMRNFGESLMIHQNYPPNFKCLHFDLNSNLKCPPCSFSVFRSFSDHDLLDLNGTLFSKYLLWQYKPTTTLVLSHRNRFSLKPFWPD